MTGPKLTPIEEAREHLLRCDPVLSKLIASIGACTLKPGGDPFAVLVCNIVAQLISTPAARTVAARLEAATQGAGITPPAMLALGEAGIRGAGLSGGKARAILDLATRAAEETLPLGRLGQMTDEEIAKHLTAVRGIGPWTVDMFLMFGLGRLDVLPVGDLGLRAGVREVYDLEEMPTPARLRELSTPWRPYRSIATWYFWRQRGFVPRS